jgi:hypothetical protein
MTYYDEEITFQPVIIFFPFTVCVKRNQKHTPALGGRGGGYWEETKVRITTFENMPKNSVDKTGACGKYNSE